MKIVTLTYVKNESDIIESLCRYTCTYADHMVIYNSDSQDDSRRIIDCLIKEGLPITVFDNKALGNPSRQVALDVLTRLIFTSLKAHWLIPVDADEFIGHVENISPRKALEKMNPLVENRISWRSYIYDKKPTEDSTFLPHYFSNYRNIEDEFEKVLLSKEQYIAYGCTHAFSFNELSYPSLESSPVPSVQIKDLFYAHYPLRGEQQTLLKVFLNCVDYELPLHRTSYSPSQFRGIYEHIIMTGGLSMNALREASLHYGLEKLPRKTIGIIEKSLNTKFCEDKLVLKYTQYEKDTEKIIQMLSVQAIEIANSYEGVDLKKALESLRKEC